MGTFGNPNHQGRAGRIGWRLREEEALPPMMVQSGASNAYTSVDVDVDVKPLARRIPRGVWIGALAAVLAVVAVTALPGALNAVSDGLSRLGSGDGRRIALALGLE